MRYFSSAATWAVELRLAYNDATAATFEEMDGMGAHYIHPGALVSEACKLIELGEIEYMNQAGRKLWPGSARTQLNLFG